MTQLVPSSGRRGRVGRMTAVMRAVRADDAEKILRVAIVERGRVVEERLIRPGVDVRVGRQGGLAPLVDEPTVTLMAVEGRGWRLCCSAVSGGRLARLESLPTTGEVLLTDDDRGKVEVGERTILFQLTEAPPKPAVASLPPSMMDGLAIDWTTTVVAAFSFLLHFFAVALVYSDWLDPRVDEDDLVASLVETTRALPTPPLLERPRAPAPSATDATDAGAAKKPGNAPASQRGSDSGARAPGPSRADSGDARAAEIAAELAALDVAMLTALSTDGPATGQVLEDDDVPSLLLDDAAASNRAARRGDANGLTLRGDGSDQVRPGGEDRRLSDLDSGTERSVDAESAGEVEDVRGPTGTANIGGTGQSGGNIANASAVVARMRGRFRACYQAGLDTDPTLQGSVSLLAKVGQSGEVVSVNGGGGSLAPIMPCLKAVVRSGGFSPPEGGMGLVSISIVFRHQ